jgi:hypothetical protein
MGWTCNFNIRNMKHRVLREKYWKATCWKSLKNDERNILIWILRTWELKVRGFIYLSLKLRWKGRAMAQAVSRRLPTVTARVRAQLMSSGICDGQSGTGAGFLRVLRFPLPIPIPPTAPHSSSTIRGWYNMPVSWTEERWSQGRLEKTA